MIEHGYRVVFKDHSCVIYKGHQAIAKAENNGNLFRLQTAKMEASARIASAAVCVHRWHRRLGHRDPKATKHLVKEELATGIKITSCSDDTVCEHCIKGKLAEMKFTENKRREKEPMRLVHSDLCGPM